MIMVERYSPVVHAFTRTDRRRRLVARHRLESSNRAASAAGVVAALAAVHSSDPATVFLSIGARLETPDIGAIEQALYVDRSLVRHHAFRRTLWVMSPAMIDAAHASATAKIAAVERRTMLRSVIESTDIPASTPDQATQWCAAALREVQREIDIAGPLTTRQIGQRLPHLTVPVILGAGTKHAGTAAAHTRILLVAGFDAVLLRTAPSGGWNSAEYAWADPSAWLGGPLGSSGVREAAATVVDAWLRRFGPATETDLRWWTGWTLAQLRTALGDVDAEPVDLGDDGSGWIAAGDRSVPEPEASVALLPGLDATTMGWKERSWYLSDAASARTFDRWGNAGPTIWRNGEIVGGWAQREDGTVAIELYTALTADEQRQLDDEIDRFRAFVGDTRIRVRFPSANQKELLDQQG